MDSYLKGRENVGDDPKPKKQEPFAPQGIGQLQAPADAESQEVQESCGEEGSKVQYVMEEGKVAKIVVTCACGQVTEIDCQYDE